MQKQKCVKSSSVNVTQNALGLFGSGLQDYLAVKHGTLKMAVQGVNVLGSYVVQPTTYVFKHFVCMTVALC